MGIYDRDYSRGSQPGFHLTAPTTATMQLLVITAGVFVLQLLFENLTPLLALKSDWWRRPWEFYTLLTYGFAHSTGSGPGQVGVAHIFGNMLVLWLFGTEVERHYGRTKFIAFYLTAIIASGLFWTICEDATGSRGTVIGASGATTALVILFALNFPNLDILFMFAIPMKMWMLGAIVIAGDMWGAMKQEGEVAFTVHLGGAAYAWLYYKTNWSPGVWLFNSAKSLARNQPKLRVHAPDDDEEVDSLTEQVDRILEKIQQQGQDSLTWKERRTLERASKEYQQKRK